MGLVVNWYAVNVVVAVIEVKLKENSFGINLATILIFGTDHNYRIVCLTKDA